MKNTKYMSQHIQYVELFGHMPIHAPMVLSMQPHEMDLSCLIRYILGKFHEKLTWRCNLVNWYAAMLLTPEEQN